MIKIGLIGWNVVKLVWLVECGKIRLIGWNVVKLVWLVDCGEIDLIEWNMLTSIGLWRKNEKKKKFTKIVKIWFVIWLVELC